jgi:hypothetical protein
MCLINFPAVERIMEKNDFYWGRKITLEFLYRYYTTNCFFYRSIPHKFIFAFNWNIVPICILQVMAAQ